jgi:hypothetical protein
MSTHRKVFIFILLVALLMAPSACSTTTKTTAMVGMWLDDNKMVTTIVVKGDGVDASRVDYILASTIQRYLVSSSYENGVLTWSYWAPTKPGITTMKTVSITADNLVVDWSNDQGGSGQMTLKRTDKAPYTTE